MGITFDDREKSFERKFAHDKEFEFKVNARRNKLFGQWAAEKLGKTGGEIENYAKDVILADMEEKGDEDVLRKVQKDLAAGGVELADKELRLQLEQFHEQARAELMNTASF